MLKNVPKIISPELLKILCEMGHGDEILMQLMECDEGKINPVIWQEYEKIAEKHDKNVKIGNIDRFAFYERAKTAFAVIATGEEAVYANIILKKGVIK